jgi:hypothetical protein
MGVIFGYLSPLYGVLFFLLLKNGVTPDIFWLYAILFFLVFTIFSTLSFPIALVYWSFFSESYRLPPFLALALLTIFVAIIFFIPAGFLQVSKSGSYLSAFNFKAAFSTMFCNFHKYLIAWYHSILMSLFGHFALPFSPWGVVWCYLGIIFEFNSILADEAKVDSKSSWFQRLQEKDAIVVESTNNSFVFRCANFLDVDANHSYLIKFGSIFGDC